MRQGRAAGLAAALWLGLAAAAAAGSPAFVFACDGWRFAVGEPEVYAYQVVTPARGGLALSVTLKPEAAAALEARTGGSLGEALTVLDGDGAVLVETVLEAPIRGRFAVAFADPEAAQRAARRMLGQE